MLYSLVQRATVVLIFLFTGILATSPSLEPSQMPSDVPSQFPSQFPSQSPSQSPSQFPSSFGPSAEPCFNTPGIISGTLITCKFITKNNKRRETRRNKWCKGDVLAKCRQACGVCCGDDDTFKFKTFKGKRGCGFLTREVNGETVLNENRSNKLCERDKINELCSLSCGIRAIKFEQQNFVVKTPSCVTGVRG